MKSGSLLKSFFNVTTIFAWIVFVMQFILLAASFASSNLANLPQWYPKGTNGEMATVAFVVIAGYVISKFFDVINMTIVRISAKISKKNQRERLDFILSEDYHTPYPLNFIWVVVATVATSILFYVLQPFAGWGSDPELTDFFVSGDTIAYIVTVLGIYRILAKSWDLVEMKALFLKNFKNEKEDGKTVQELLDNLREARLKFEEAHNVESNDLNKNDDSTNSSTDSDSQSSQKDSTSSNKDEKKKDSNSRDSSGKHDSEKSEQKS